MKLTFAENTKISRHYLFFFMTRKIFPSFPILDSTDFEIQWIPFRVSQGNVLQEQPEFQTCSMSDHTSCDGRVPMLSFRRPIFTSNIQPTCRMEKNNMLLSRLYHLNSIKIKAGLEIFHLEIEQLQRTPTGPIPVKFITDQSSGGDPVDCCPCKKQRITLSNYIDICLCLSKIHAIDPTGKWQLL